MANVLIPFPGASARDVEQMVATPAEQVLVADRRRRARHVALAARAGACSRCSSRSACRAPRRWCACTTRSTRNADWLPRGLGVGEPLIKPKGIDDVPIVTLTLYARDRAIGAFDLERVAHSARGRAQARARHARGDARSAARARGARRARSGAHGRRRRDRRRPAPARCSRPTSARRSGELLRRQPRGRGRGRAVPARCPRRRRAGRRRARRQAGLPAGRGAPSATVRCRRAYAMCWHGVAGSRRSAANTRPSPSPSPRSRARTPSTSPTACMRARRRRCATRVIPARRRSRRHAQLRRHRQRQGAEAHPEAAVRHRFGRRAGASSRSAGAKRRSSAAP